MPFTVITLKNVPPSLRGDLTKWMQEIATGVYVGNFNSRIRSWLWQRVCDAVGSGEATLSFTNRSEIGYDFMTVNAQRQVVDYEGIPLVLIPGAEKEGRNGGSTNGFSTAAKMRMARRSVREKAPVRKETEASDSPGDYVVLDLETTGLDIVHDQIIEIGALKYEKGDTSCFQRLVRISGGIPAIIEKLTGITDQMLADGVELEAALREFLSFAGDLPLVGYNLGFDLKFMEAGMRSCGLPAAAGNRTCDLLKLVKKEKLFQRDYKLSTTLKSYEIEGTVPHRALEDARLVFELSRKVNIFDIMAGEEGRI